MDKLTEKVLNAIERAKHIDSSFEHGYGNYVGVTVHTIHDLTLQEYNGLFKVFFNGIEIGFIRDKEYLTTRDALGDKKKLLKNKALNEFING